MTLAMFSGRPDNWSRLQQPAARADRQPQLLLLLSALDQGWHVEEPVYLRPRFGVGSPRVYHFILTRNGAAPHLITTPECHEATAFVQQEGLAVKAD
jgi:hypothetical protein